MCFLYNGLWHKCYRIGLFPLQKKAMTIMVVAWNVMVLYVQSVKLGAKFHDHF